MSDKVFETEQYYGELADVFKEKLKNKPLIYRLTGQKHRIYFTKADENSPATVYNSGTTLIKNYRDEGGEQAIHNWKVGLVNAGKDPDVVLKTRQNYGTLLHVLYGKILMGEKTTFKDLKKFIIGCHEEARLKKDYVESLVSSHLWEFKKDIASFMTWLKENQVEPLAVELMLKSDKYKVATALDLICYVTVKEKGFWGEVYKTGKKKGEPKETFDYVRKLAIVDFKSGKKGFYEKNVLQLLLSKKIFEENFPDMQVEAIYNLAPNDWNTSPTYKFYDQERDTSQIEYLKAIQENVFQRGLMEFTYKLKERTEIVLEGTIDAKGEDTFELKEVTLEEMANRYYQEKFVNNRGVFEELLDEQNLTNEEELETFLLNQETSYLKELAKGIGITYTNKSQLITTLKNKFSNGEKKA